MSLQVDLPAVGKVWDAWDLVGLANEHFLVCMLTLYDFVTSFHWGIPHLRLWPDPRRGVLHGEGTTMLWSDIPVVLEVVFIIH